MQLPTLEHYAALVRRHLVLIVAGMLLGTAGGVLYLRAEPVSYTATTEVLLAPLPTHARTDASVRDPRPVTIDTDAAILESSPVVRAVRDATGLADARIHEALTVDAQPLSEVLRVSFTDTRADRAEHGSEAAARTLLELRGDQLYRSRARHARRLERRLTALTDEMDTLNLTGESYNAPVASLKRRLELQHAIVYEQIALGSDAGRVFVDARTPTQASRVNPEVRIASGTMLGMLAGLGTGLFLDARRRRRGPAAESLEQ